MSDRVDNELRRVSTALAAVSPSKPDLPRPTEAKREPQMLVAVASFIVVLGIGMAAGFLFGRSSDSAPTVTTMAPTASTSQVAPDGSVPGDHLAAQLLDEGAGFEEFAEVSNLCARGGSGAGPHATCLVDDQGVLVVVPLLMAADVEAVVRGSAFDGETRVELPAVRSEDSLPALADLVAISHTGGSVEVELWYNGEPSGAVLSSEVLSPPGDPSAIGTIPIPDDHVANEILARGADRTEIPDLAREMGFESSCGAGRGFAVESCVIWEDSVAVVIPLTTIDGVTAEISSPSYERRVDIPFEAGQPVGVRHETGLFTLLHYFPDEETPTSYGSYFPASSAP